MYTSSRRELSQRVSQKSFKSIQICSNMFLDKKVSTFKEHGKWHNLGSPDVIYSNLIIIFRQVKGVIQINIDDRKDNRRATISIYAETEDAAKKARQVKCGASSQWSSFLCSVRINGKTQPTFLFLGFEG